MRLALPQRSPMPFSVPWIWRTPASTAASELATAWPVSSWAWMPRWSPGMTCARPRRRSRSTSSGMRAAIGVAEHHPARAGIVGRLGAGQRIVRDWPCSRRRNARSRPAPPCRRRRAASTDCADGVEVLLVGAAERDADVIVPGLGDEADGVGVRVEERARGRDRWRPRRPARLVMPKAVKSRARRALLGEEGGVGRVGAGIAALDIVDAELVEQLGDERSCPRARSRCRRLRAVAQRRVEEVEAFLAHATRYRRVRALTLVAARSAVSWSGCWWFGGRDLRSRRSS